MSDYLHRYYGKKVIILLDEYDTPMQEAYVDGFWDELVAFTRSMFNATFKTNPWLERGLMTGITRVSKESIFSDLNNLKVVTTTSDEYATAFGFTEQEVFAALVDYGLGKEKNKVKQWYDGFIFGYHKDIYNPWSILNFLDTGKITTYWANTSSNSLVGKLIREGDRRIKEKFERLLKGEVIHTPIDEQIVYNQLDGNEEAVWSLILASGYLKVLSHDRLDLLEPGRFYHGFVLGLLVDLQDRYVITSNRESGFGRYDVMFEPKNPQEDDAIILEFKVFNKRRENSLEDTVEEALRQIDKKQYAAGLMEKGISKDRIRKYGFAFEGKNVLIG